MTQTAPSFSHGKPLSGSTFTWSSGRPQYIASMQRRMRARARLGWILPFLCVLNQVTFGQKSEPVGTVNADLAERIAEAVRVERPPRLDGTLGDPVWIQASPITDFRQREPYEGQPATERTEVRVLYTRNEIYFGIACHDSAVNGPVATQLRRDVTQELDDYFEIVIDSRRDRRNAYVFQINPLGTQRDALITDEQAGDTQDGDPGWDGIWTSEARMTSDGWTATVAIPFSTLNFMRSRDVVWGNQDQPSGRVAWDQRNQQRQAVHSQAICPRRLQSLACQCYRQRSDSGYDR